MSKRGLIFIFLGLTIFSIKQAIALPSHCSYRYSIQNIRVDNRQVEVELYTPSIKDPPLLLMLHSSAGVYTHLSPQEPKRDNFGEKLFASHCFLVALPHYFDLINRTSLLSPSDMRIEAPQLIAGLNIILDSLEQSLPYDHQRIAIFGESLGAILGVELTLTRREIKALSEVGGSLQIMQTPKSTSAQVLLIHGGQDNIVLVDQAIKLSSYLTQHSVANTLHIYPQQGHYLTVTPDSEAIRDTLTFLRSVFLKRDGCPSDEQPPRAVRHADNR